MREYPKCSSRLIADLCHVSHTCVESIRDQLATDASYGTREGKDGRSRKRPSQRQAAGAEKAYHEESNAEPSVVHPALSGSADEATEPEPSDADSFDPASEWFRIKNFLDMELKIWPRINWGDLGNRLRDYASQVMELDEQ